ncbi:hypothetical protein B9Q02_04865 [Candidatus Marsarchaeota G1 archaeon BE_D]|uniref:Uncharacterized protein n=1 Tax=Candidatus Marsarchaeota G1 archaeon BE_D TaxID=1978156 RepID=A0A2R6AHG6_9ARCH|nr:MAG: hypothetical protein B9Q02_04865 [Candidatus Marsarchaeota G1 archaeon BE_D]
MNKVLTFKASCLIFVAILALLLFVHSAISSDGTPFLSFKVRDQNGNPLANVSIQGFMISPVANQGFLPLFNGSTNSLGVATFSGSRLSRLMNVLSEWVSKRGLANLSASSPTILVFATYTNQNGVYFRQTSVNLVIPDLLENPAYYQTITFNLSAPPVVSSKEALTTAQAPLNPQSQTTLPNPGAPCGISPSCWVGVGSPNLWPSSSTGKIPIAWIDNLGGGAYGEVSVALGIASNVEWDVGLGIGSGESIPSPEFEAGGTAWTTTTSVVFGQAVDQFSPGASYVYIMGQVVGELFQLYKCNLYNIHLGYCTGGYSPTNTYQYDTGIVNVATSDGYIVGGRGSGFPFYYNELGSDYTINYFESVTGTGDSTPNYKVYSNQFVQAWASSDYGWISVGIPLGALLVAAGVDIPVAVATAISIDGAYTAGSASFSLAWAQFDGSQGSTVYLYDYVGVVSYYLTNGNTGYVPLMGVYISG